MRELCGATSIDYIYGTEGIAGFIVDKDTNNEATYVYRKNIFGDVTAVYNDDGILQCTYEYDAWGNHVIYDADGKVVDGNSDNIGLINPIRYRGYYFDEETGLYYLKTRYYDPQVGRFMTIDNLNYLEPEKIAGLNLYDYCYNNPIMYYDPIGCFPLTIFLILAATTIIGASIAGVKASKEGKKGWDFAKTVALGGFLGLAAGGAIVALGAVGAGAIGAITGNTAATVFGGVAVTQAFAIGALAFNFTAFIIAPLYGFEMEGIEFRTPEPPYKLPNKTPTNHPAEKGIKRWK